MIKPLCSFGIQNGNLKARMPGVWVGIERIVFPGMLFSGIPVKSKWIIILTDEIEE